MRRSILGFLVLTATAVWGQTITTIQSTDLVSDSRAVINSNFQELSTKMWKLPTYNDLTEITTPGTSPASGFQRLYVKSGSGICWKTSAGVETCSGGIQAAARGGLGVDASAFSGVVKMATGAASIVTGNASDCVKVDGSSAACAAGSGASASRDLTDLRVTKTSGTVLDIAAGAFGADESSWLISASVLTIKSFAVTGVDTSNPAVITFGAGGLTGVVQNGDTVTIVGVTGTGCTGINTTAVVAGHNNTELTLTGVSGSGCTYSSGGTMAGAGNGTAYVYGNNSGSLTLEVPVASAVLAAVTTGSGVVNQITTPSFPGNGVPLASCTIISGAWGACTDQRRFLSTRSVTAGTGISVAAGGEVAIDTALVPQLGGSNTWTGANDFAAATVTGLIVKVAGYEVGAENAAAALVDADLTNHAFAVNDASAKTLTEASCVSDAGDQTVVVKVGSTTKLTIHCVSPASYSRSTVNGTTGYLNAANITDTAIAAGAMLDLSGTANTTTKGIKLHIFGRY